jgi:hypothetical protein
VLFIPSCKEVSRLVSESLDRELSLRQRCLLRLHLLMCSLCSRFRRQLLFLREAAHALGNRYELPGQARLSPEARTRIQRALEQSR